MKDIREDIKTGNFRPVYLICGEEAYLRQDLKQRLKKALVGDDAMNYTYAEGRGIDVEELIATAETLPFFAPRRLILVENSGFFRVRSSKKQEEKPASPGERDGAAGEEPAPAVPSRNDEENGEEESSWNAAGTLASYLPEMPATTCMVFVEETVDKRSSLYKKIVKLGHAAECRRPEQGELRNWAVRGLNQAGKKIRPSTLDEFLQDTGNDMENVRQELNKLIAYVGEREVITTQDVRAITTVQLVDRIYVMIDAVAVKNRKRALSLYYDLLALKEPPMRILAIMTDQFAGILHVKELWEKDIPRNEIAARLGLTGKKAFLVDRYRNQARRFSREELEDCVARCVEAGENVRMGKLSEGLAAELLIVELSS